MPQFRYVAKNMEGKTMRGVLEASGENVLQQQLKEQGLFLIEAKDAKGSKKVYKFSSAQLAEFCREMSHPDANRLQHCAGAGDSRG